LHWLGQGSGLMGMSESRSGGAGATWVGSIYAFDSLLPSTL
jgi:hypothetical protein